MDYEKAYNEAIKRAKAIIEVAEKEEEVYKSAITIFPELRESEDEQIRKEFCKDIWTFIPNEKAHKYISWLAKQGNTKLDKFWETARGVKPSTKEQRDTLLKAMADAGYTFDFGKKELKKIEKKSQRMVSAEAKEALYDKPDAWSEKDESIALGIEQLCNCASLLNIAPDKIDKIRTWLKSLKDRVQPQPDMVEALRTEYEKGKADAIAETQKEWSEDDEKRLQSCINILKAKSLMGKVDTANTMWLKSLKDRYTWKPSDKQIKALKYVAYHLMPDTNYRKEMFSLYEDLKKLREGEL